MTEREWDFYNDEEDGGSLRWGCVLGSRCLMPDPEHFSSECHSVEDLEAEMEGRE